MRLNRWRVVTAGWSLLVVSSLGAWEVLDSVCESPRWNEVTDLVVLSSRNILVAGRCTEFVGDAQQGPLFLALYAASGARLFSYVADSILPEVTGRIWLNTAPDGSFWIAYQGYGGTVALRGACASSSCTLEPPITFGNRSLVAATVDARGNLNLVMKDSTTSEYPIVKMDARGMVWETIDTAITSVNYWVVLDTDDSGNVFVAYQRYGNTYAHGYRHADGAHFWVGYLPSGFPVDLEIIGGILYGINRDSGTGIWDSTREDILVYAIPVGSPFPSWQRLLHRSVRDRPSDLLVKNGSVKIWGVSDVYPIFGSLRASDGWGGLQVWTVRQVTPPNLYREFNHFPGFVPSNDKYLVYNPVDGMYYAIGYTLDSLCASTPNVNGYCHPVILRYSASGTVYASWISGFRDTVRSLPRSAALAVDPVDGWIYGTTMAENQIWLMQISPYIPICRKCQIDGVAPPPGEEFQITLLTRELPGQRFLVYDRTGRQVGVLPLSRVRTLPRGFYWLHPLGKGGEEKSLRIFIP